MKKARDNMAGKTEETGMADEYRFDYGESRPNRFAERIAQNAVVVVLDPDVAEVFRDPARVNSFLRAAIDAVEHKTSAKVA